MIIGRIPRTPGDLASPGFVRSAPPAWAERDGLPFHIRRVTLRPGEATAPHNHHDTEVWIILDGRGVLGWNGADEPVQAGDSVELTPLGVHTLHNTDPAKPLTFLTLWWEDMASFARAHADRLAVAGRDERPVVLLPSFPTPNGELHLGHLAGPYLAADTSRRALIARGTPAHLLLGTVGHQSQVAVAAGAAGMSFTALAERNTDAIVEALAAAEIGWDVFVRPSAPEYPDVARQVFEKLRRTGAVVAKRVPANYCAGCARYLFEAFVAGACPHCGSRDTAGIECESCARPFADAELVEPSCTTCGAAAQQRELTRYFLPLEPLRPWLTGYLSSVAMSARLRSYLDRVLAEPLPDLPVTIVAEDGIPVPVGPDEPELSGQRLYSAFELVGRYLTALGRLAAGQGFDDWAAYAAAERPRTVLFFGYDNAYLRAVVFPAVLSSFTDTVAPPETMVCNEFYTLDGAKFSTGRRHAIWGRGAFAPHTRDQLRLYLALTRPDIRRRDFSVGEYTGFVRTTLLDWQDWLDDVGRRVERAFGGVAPEAGAWNAECERFYQQIRELVATVRPACLPERLDLRAAAEALVVFVARARRFGETCADLLGSDPPPGVARTGMALELMAVRAASAAAAPLAPGLAGRLAVALGLSEEDIRNAEPRWVEPGTRVRLGERLFAPDAVLDAAPAVIA